MTLFSVSLEDLECRTRLGVRDWERKGPQSVLVSLSGIYAINETSWNDQLSQTLDYSALASSIEDFLGSSDCDMLESLLMNLRDHLIKNFPFQTISLSIEKPGIVKGARSLSLSLHSES